MLLDTHALLWALDESDRLSARASAALADPAIEKMVSAASAYEICLKHALGKLPSAAALARSFDREIDELDVTPLPITIAHAAAAGRLPMTHKDPFDRLLIAQALVEQVPLVSNETLFDGFGVERLW